MVIEASYWKRAGEVPMSAVHTMIPQVNNDEVGYQRAYELHVDRHVLVSCASHFTEITYAPVGATHIH